MLRTVAPQTNTNEQAKNDKKNFCKNEKTFICKNDTQLHYYLYT